MHAYYRNYRKKKLPLILLPKDRPTTILFFIIFISLITDVHVYAPVYLILMTYFCIRLSEISSITYIVIRKLGEFIKQNGMWELENIWTLW